MPKLTYILISSGWDGFPIAYRLMKEGYDVLVGQVQDKSELGFDEKEDPEDKEARLKQYDGMLDKYPARKLVDSLKKVKNKDEYFIYCDQNNLFVYAEELLAAGFTKGIFPTKEDYEFEKNRDDAMAFVKENYPDVSIIPYEEFATVAEAEAFLRNPDKVYVMQSKGDYVSTIVPSTDDPEQGKVQLLNQLEKNKADYEKGGIILKEKLISPVEITPQMVFCNGQPVFTDIDIETKNIGDGENNGNQVGCGTNLIIRTELKDKINKIAFPPIVMQMAQKHTGIFVWDISLYILHGKLYFGEFCSNRFGYDAIMTEMTMSEGAGKYFENIIWYRNPLKHTFGVAARMFNLNRKEETEMSWADEVDQYMWMYEVTKKDDAMLSLGDCWDLGVVTNAGDDIGETVEALYRTIDQLSFKEKYYRSRADFMGIYPTSIMFRFLETNHIYFEAPELKEIDEAGEFDRKLRNAEENFKAQIKENRAKYDDDLAKHRQEIVEILAQNENTN